MATELVTGEELEAAIQALFNSTDTLTTQMEAVELTANTALETANAAKEALINIHTVPTNGWDVVMSISRNVAIIAFVGVSIWGLYKLCTYDPEIKRQKEIQKSLKILKDIEKEGDSK